MLKYITNFLKKEQTYSAVGRKLLKLAFPIIGSYLLHMTYNLTDMIWVGYLGSGAVAAVGSAGFFLHLGWAMASIVTVGANVKIAHSVGAENMDDAGRYSTSGLWGIGSIAILFTSVFLAIPEQFIGFFQMKDAAVNEMATSYLVISAFGIIISFVNLLFISIFNAHGKTKISFKASVIGTLINIVLDPLLIIVFEFGVEGAAVASIVGRTFSLLFFLSTMKKFENIRFNGLFPKSSKLKTLFAVGMPAAVQRISFSVIYIFLARIIADWGPNAIAVQKIGVQIESITFMIVGGLMQAVTIMVGHSYGAKNLTEVPNIYRAGWRIAFVVAMVTTAIFLLLPQTLFSIFVPEAESILMGKDYLMILAASQLFMCLEMISAGVFNGLGKTKIPAAVSVIFTSLRLPGAYFLGFYTFLSLNGVWWSITGSSILKGIVLYFLLRAYFKNNTFGKF
ncbi:MATE family efflux transporter [Labilibaculum sp. DW002]|uniref:Multidrug-efflux transporter n=1 Tax=Paralabilibaculum antarcticum TaxID=2912572 RepID=A0ABT5VN25_9BACT|nr:MULTISPECIES: MATE family efflux transporter [unclassified Labilibaculum]MBI9059370.1 MATE family efflux transporter [Labilibaculum sp.]MDE5416841.1 MATE family efflux transporter [Labilibaculum sp. DW002]